MSLAAEAWQYRPEQVLPIEVPFVQPDVEKVVDSEDFLEDREALVQAVHRTILIGRNMLSEVGIAGILSELNTTVFAGEGELTERADTVPLYKLDSLGFRTLDRVGVISSNSLAYVRRLEGSQRLFGALTIGMRDDGIWAGIDVSAKSPDNENSEEMLNFYNCFAKFKHGQFFNLHSPLGTQSVRSLINNQVAVGQHAIDSMRVETIIRMRDSILEMRENLTFAA
jgi:hypothetical protein